MTRCWSHSSGRNWFMLEVRMGMNLLRRCRGRKSRSPRILLLRRCGGCPAGTDGGDCGLLPGLGHILHRLPFRPLELQGLSPPYSLVKTSSSSFLSSLSLLRVLLPPFTLPTEWGWQKEPAKVKKEKGSTSGKPQNPYPLGEVREPPPPHPPPNSRDL